MRYTRCGYLALAVLGSSLLHFSCFLGRCQSSAQEKLSLQEFGSSLKRLKWDPKKRTALETRNQGEKEKGSGETDVIRVETALVVCDVLVLDAAGRPVQGLTRDDFMVNEDGAPQQVGTFVRGDNTSIPRSIVLIIDYSGSQLPYIDRSVEAAKSLVDQLGPADKMAIVTDDIRLLADFTSDKAELKSRLESLKKEALREEAMTGWRAGHSLQFSALLASLRELFGREDQRPIVIFQTDGDETRILPPISSDASRVLKNIAREFSLADVYQAALRARATIYSVIPGIRLVGLSSGERLKRAQRIFEESVKAHAKAEAKEFVPGQVKVFDRTLRRIAEINLRDQSAVVGAADLTGGWAEFLEDASQAAGIYARILSDINHRYLIGYYPANKQRDGKRRMVEVEVRGRPEYKVLTRKSYYAPGPDEFP